MIEIDLPLPTVPVGNHQQARTKAIRARRVVQGWLREICDPERTYVGMSCHSRDRGDWTLHIKFIGGDERGNAILFKLRHHGQSPVA